MIGKCWVVASLLVSAALTAGCQGQQGQVAMTDRLQRENTELKQRVSALENEKDGMRQEVLSAKRELGGVQLDAQKWKAKYEAAKSEIPEGVGGVPAELVRKFIEIAQAGGPFELGPAGSLKASSDILFDSGKIDLKPNGQAALRDIAPKLKEILADKRVMLRIDGHTDNTPIRFSPWKDNLHLSLMRARAVMDHLTTQGVPTSTMFAAGFGEWHPVTDNTTPEGQAKNRRVELSLISVAAPVLPVTGAPE